MSRAPVLLSPTRRRKGGLPRKTRAPPGSTATAAATGTGTATAAGAATAIVGATAVYHAPARVSAAQPPNWVALRMEVGAGRCIERRFRE